MNEAKVIIQWKDGSETRFDSNCCYINNKGQQSSTSQEIILTSELNENYEHIKPEEKDKRND